MPPCPIIWCTRPERNQQHQDSSQNACFGILQQPGAATDAAIPVYISPACLHKIEAAPQFLGLPPLSCHDSEDQVEYHQAANSAGGHFPQISSEHSDLLLPLCGSLCWTSQLLPHSSFHWSQTSRLPLCQTSWLPLRTLPSPTYSHGSPMDSVGLWWDFFLAWDWALFACPTGLFSHRFCPKHIRLHWSLMCLVFYSPVKSGFLPRNEATGNRNRSRLIQILRDRNRSALDRSRSVHNTKKTGLDRLQLVFCCKIYRT